MFKTKRKRAVVLALIAFFCTAAVTYVAVDWKRFGGGVLAFFKGDKKDPSFASTGGSSGADQVKIALGGNQNASAPPMVAPGKSHKHASGVGGGANGARSDDDLFKYGNPAAGGIPPGSFIVAQNDTPGGGNAGGAIFAAPAGAPAVPETSGAGTTGGGDAGGAGVTAPAPAPAGVGSEGGGGKATPPAPPAATPPATGTPPAPPAATPPVAGTPPASPTPSPAAPAPAPTQSGSTDDPGTPAPPVDSPAPPVSSLPPVSAVPEASSTAMMTLGLLFAAVAATRKRKQS